MRRAAIQDESGIWGGWSLPPCQRDGEQGVASSYIKKRIGEQELEEDHSFKHSVKECLLERMGARGLQMIHTKMHLNSVSQRLTGFLLL